MTDRDMHLGAAFEAVYTTLDRYKLSDVETLGLLDLIKHDIMADSRDAQDEYTDCEIDGLQGDN